jgi:TrmH family RNA methyltransferase
MFEVDLSGPLIAVFGGEGSGLPASLLGTADLTLRIPLERDIESLNVAAAVAMTCYERMRQLQS